MFHWNLNSTFPSSTRYINREDHVVTGTNGRNSQEMARASDEVSLFQVRLEELVRILDLHEQDSRDKCCIFRAKLGSLKERQELVQMRRVTRLRKEGINIDLESVKRKARFPKDAVWGDNEAERELRQKVNERMRETFQQVNETSNDSENDSEYEIESDTETEALFEHQNDKCVQKRASRSDIIFKGRSSGNLSIIVEDDTTFKGETNIKEVKSVEVRVKRTGSKRHLKTVGTVATTTSHMINKEKKAHLRRKGSRKGDIS